jgi:hypothetical protein
MADIASRVRPTGNRATPEHCCDLAADAAHDLWQVGRDLVETVRQIPTLHAV